MQDTQCREGCVPSLKGRPVVHGPQRIRKMSQVGRSASTARSLSNDPVAALSPCTTAGLSGPTLAPTDYRHGPESVDPAQFGWASVPFGHLG
jgi:hypothetical protein